jgi:hypothetical protein
MSDFAENICLEKLSLPYFDVASVIKKIEILLSVAAGR